MTRNSQVQLIKAGVGLLLLALGALFVFHWTVNRVYVEDGFSLRLRYKGPLVFGSRKTAQPGQFAEEGEIGVIEQLRGPGRHFYCPIWWEREIVPDMVIQPGEVAIVTSKLGADLPPGEFLVDGDLDGEQRAQHKGILRKVFSPGRYRYNPYAFEFKTLKANTEQVGEQTKHSGWVEVPIGFVGVMTFLAENKLEHRKIGIQDAVLPPGLYPINPREQQVDIVEIGFRETAISTEKQMDPDGKTRLDESGEPLALLNSGINFPSNDGFDIQLDYSAVWGVMPKDAPDVVRTFGTVDQADQKVILPQSESICRNNGSKMGAVELLVGETRQSFQDTTSDEFRKVLQEKKLTLLYGLVRHIYIPQEVRIPIQNGYIAEELTKTREQEKITAQTEADLREAERKVEYQTEKVRVETEKVVANAMAEGQKEAKETAAETVRMVAEVEKKIAELDAKKSVMLGEAENKAKQLQQEATSQKFQLAVEAFGDPQAYNKWQFAQGLPDEIDLRLLYAGQGTLWTDLKNLLPTLPIQPPPAKPKTAPAAK